jgi:hypothetical protein
MVALDGPHHTPEALRCEWCSSQVFKGRPFWQGLIVWPNTGVKAMACDVKSPHKDYPKLGCKAAECKHFMPALLPVIKAMLDSTD